VVAPLGALQCEASNKGPGGDGNGNTSERAVSCILREAGVEMLDGGDGNGK